MHSNFYYDDGAYLSLYEQGAALMSAIDEKLLSFLCGYSYQEVHIPSLIHGSVLRKCGYFNSFPQHITPVGFLKERKVQGQSETVDKEIGFNDYYLTPAACLHIYPMLEHACKENSVYTTCEAVFRYENGDFRQSERLWEFSVREMVFVGSKKYVLDGLEFIKAKSLAFAKNVFGEGRVQEASDNFYPSRENEVKKRLQQANGLKQELLLTLEGKEIAVASFNFHDHHFSNPFHFANGGKIVTGCVGFGLERWVLCAFEKSISESSIRTCP